MVKKKCFKCGEQKPLNDFYKHPTMGDGHLGKCKVCTKHDVRAHRKDNESVREYDRRRHRTSRARREHVAENARRWKSKYPARYKASNAVSNAVRDGRITKPHECSKCGKNGRVHGHHDDYSKPLDVRWLCPRCHAAHHAA